MDVCHFLVEDVVLRDWCARAAAFVLPAPLLPPPRQYYAIKGGPPVLRVREVGLPVSLDPRKENDYRCRRLLSRRANLWLGSLHRKYAIDDNNRRHGSQHYYLGGCVEPD